MRFSIPRYWRERHSHYRLYAKKCPKCGRVNYPPSNICRYCGSTELEDYYLDSEKAKIISWTIIYPAPEGFEEQRPRIIALLETLETKTHIIAPLTDILPEEIKEGLIVEPVLRRIKEDREAGLIHYAIAYRPVIGSIGTNKQ